ncbi:MAG: hypothetical protein Q9220_001407 [cf. Caloplaca sp. 1 TL-2023]
MPDQAGESFGSLEDLLSYLSVVESSVESEVNKIAESIDAVTDRISASLRTAMGDSAWFPAFKPPPPPPSPTIITKPLGYFGASKDWVSRHRAITAAVVCFFGTGAYLIWRQRRANRVKRRAKRAKNGQRTEVVLLAGPPSAPLTRSLSLDLERRGFIVYIPAATLGQERLIQAESKPDIRPMHLDVTSPSSLSSAIRKFTSLLDPANAPKYPLHFASFILLPQTTFPPQPQSIADLSADSWSDTFSENLLYPFTLIHAFLPLVLSHNASILFLTPTNTSTLLPPLHAPENVIAGAMHNYISTLRKELATTSARTSIIRFKLGAFDTGSDRDALKMAVALRHDGHDAASSSPSVPTEQRTARGSPLRDLHLEVFDAIVGRRRGTVCVGRGSRTYDLLGRVMPEGLVGWMLGLNARVKEQRGEGEKVEEKTVHESPSWERVEQFSGDDSA